MQLRAPAKINLSFGIRGRRDDGFHEIETLMAAVSLYDQLTITRSAATGHLEFRCDDPSIPTGEDNLVVRAARLFLAATAVRNGVGIKLQKAIPHGAGLGGGSSDAAATLVGLNALFETNLRSAELAALGAQLGSDVPFFIYRSLAICRGRGELVEPTALPHQLSLLLLKPDFGVPTPWAYSRWRDSRELPSVPYSPQSFAGLTFVNDLERPVFEKHVFLAATKQWLLEQREVSVALMSGSGSTLFTILRESGAAQALAARAKDELDSALWTWPCETLASW